MGSNENGNYSQQNYHKRPGSYNNSGGGYRSDFRGGSRRIPDRWLCYDPVGRPIEGTRFVAFKTPLDSDFFRNKPELHQDDFFDVRTLLQYARDANSRIGMVIDLTNTDRYYTKTDWSLNGVKYMKLNCPGHEVSEREDLVNEFLSAVDDYLKVAQNDDSLIGVHCTHGLNRTGFLICRYMIDRMGWTADRAISQFEHDRGHPIERAKYKEALRCAYTKKVQESDECTETSTTKKDVSITEHSNGDQQDDGAETSDKSTKKGEELLIQGLGSSKSENDTNHIEEKSLKRSHEKTTIESGELKKKKKHIEAESNAEESLIEQKEIPKSDDKLIDINS